MHRSFVALDERYFGELCLYSDAHDALLRNEAALLDAHAFGEVFDATLDAMDAWTTVRRTGAPFSRRWSGCGEIVDHHLDSIPTNARRSPLTSQQTCSCVVRACRQYQVVSGYICRLPPFGPGGVKSVASAGSSAEAMLR